MFNKTNVKIGAAVLFFASLFLTWIKASAVLVGTLTATGFDKLGGLDVFILAAVAAGLAVSAYRGKSTKVLSIVAGALAVYYYTQIHGNVSDANSALGGYGTASVGVGVYLMLVAAATSVVASWKK